MAEYVEANKTVLEQDDWKKAKSDLAEKGYTVLKGVLTEAECDEYIREYREWVSQFGEDGVPFQLRSLIQQYHIGHFESSWRIRLKAKPVFANLWNTEKLLSSFDGVAIGEPPETSGKGFARDDEKWLHIDQGEYRQGLHAYQGGVYLEETTETDWVFRVLANSHKHHQLFYESHPGACNRGRNDFCRLKDREIQWYTEKGCELTKVPVPKGGMVLWDSRLIHDSQRPEYGRPNADRWRFVAFVSMTPAIWANSADLNVRQTAYKRMFLTTHWSSQGAHFFPNKTSHLKHVRTIEYLPPIAKTDEAKFLAGMLDYDFEDGRPNGEEFLPVWTFGDYSDNPVVPSRPPKHKRRPKRAK